MAQGIPDTEDTAPRVDGRTEAPPPATSAAPARPGQGLAGGSSFPMKNSPQMLSAPTGSKRRARKKVFIKPGFSQMDWMRLTTSGADLRGVTELQRLTMDEVAKHNKRDDCWTVLHGRVYNITRYLDFHPGGHRELMRVAGKDGSALFFATHAWVNFEAMLRECLVGMVVDSNGAR
ncbi:hypothetical protein GGF46_001418 [Coemansia sp. RSA 552]|nr:hypothetical protein GGF46_001418 [Coemansia sp. RSA 552]